MADNGGTINITDGKTSYTGPSMTILTVTGGITAAHGSTVAMDYVQGNFSGTYLATQGSTLSLRDMSSITFSPGSMLAATGGSTINLNNYTYNSIYGQSPGPQYAPYIHLNGQLVIDATSTLSIWGFNTLYLEPQLTTAPDLGSSPVPGLMAWNNLFINSPRQYGVNLIASGDYAIGATGSGVLSIFLYESIYNLNGSLDLENTGGISLTNGGSMSVWASEVRIAGPIVLSRDPGSTTTQVLSIGSYDRFTRNYKIDQLILQGDLTAGPGSKMYIAGGSGYNQALLGASGAPITIRASGPDSVISIGNSGYYTAGPATGSMTIYGNVFAEQGGTVQLGESDGAAGNFYDYHSVSNTAFTLNGNLSATGSGSLVQINSPLSFELRSGQSLTAQAGGKVQIMNWLYGSRFNGAQPPLYPNATDSSFAIDAGATFFADGAGSSIYTLGITSLSTALPFIASNGATITMDAFLGTALTLTTGGDPTGQVYFNAAWNGQSLAISDTHALAANLHFQNFTAYTLTTGIEAAGAGLYFSQTPKNAIAGFIQGSDVHYTISGNTTQNYGITIRDGGYGQITFADLNNVPLSIDSTSHYNLQDVTITGGSIHNDGLLTIVPLWYRDSDHSAPVVFQQDAYPLSGTGTIYIQNLATLTTSDPSYYWQVPTGMTLTGQGTAAQLRPTAANLGTILSDTSGTLTLAAPAATATLVNPGTIRFQDNAAVNNGTATTGGLIAFSGYTTLDNSGLVETVSHIGSQAGQLLPGTLNIISSTTPGTVQANGTGVALDLVGTNATLVNQNLYALNGSTVILDGRDLSQVTLTGTGGGVFRGGTGAIGGTLGTSNQDVSALSTLSSSTLTGSGTVLQLLNSEKFAVDPASGLSVTNGATLQLLGNGGHQILSSSGTQLARLTLDSGASLIGAGNTVAHQVGLTVGNATITVANPNLASSGPNPALVPAAVLPLTNQSSPLVISGPPTPALQGNTSHQTLTVLGDLQLAANSAVNVTIFGTGVNENSLLLLGSAASASSTLAGNLNVSVTPGLNLSGNTLYVVLQDNGPLPFSGTFANAPAGNSTLRSTDGSWLFGVNYSNNQVFLYNATAVPEPATCAALGGLAALAAAALRRRRNRPPATPAP